MSRNDIRTATILAVCLVLVEKLVSEKKQELLGKIETLMALYPGDLESREIQRITNVLEKTLDPLQDEDIPELWVLSLISNHIDEYLEYTRNRHRRLGWKRLLEVVNSHSHMVNSITNGDVELLSKAHEFSQLITDRTAELHTA